MTECNYGQWQGHTLEGQTKNKLWKTVQSLPSAVTIPGGESAEMVAARVSVRPPVNRRSTPYSHAMINTDAPLPEDLFAALPGEDAVLGHEVAVNCDRWQDVLSTRGLPPMQGALAGPGVTVEVQVRTHLQGQWANTYEAAADVLGREIRYGELPMRRGDRRFVEALQEVSTVQIRELEDGRNAIRRMALALDENDDATPVELETIEAQMDSMEVAVQKTLSSLKDQFDKTRPRRKN